MKAEMKRVYDYFMKYMDSNSKSLLGSNGVIPYKPWKYFAK